MSWSCKLLTVTSLCEFFIYMLFSLTKLALYHEFCFMIAIAFSHAEVISDDFLYGTPHVFMLSRMMSDYTVETINDGLNEFNVEFHGPKESTVLTLMLLFLHCVLHFFNFFDGYDLPPPAPPPPPPVGTQGQLCFGCILIFHSMNKFRNITCQSIQNKILICLSETVMVLFIFKYYNR